eukprot:CAMPEP_0197252292 /NCGR_PEP_ID=MMETSP1429-20130617/60800_1 /TAXON_ID=49237 /ORGANISM="Chaetoceros  sp., Strain UNC1202" /LENGTH=51 /DNA_ID=CAMNT_0042714639 /DNA_START=30 /DNA_END=181 /DNA_ORIENTATION=-
MFAGRMRSSDDFAMLLDWKRLDVTEGMAVPKDGGGSGSGGSNSSRVTGMLT